MDCVGLCDGDDGHRYYLKAANKRHAAHNEWFCTHLAAKIGIGTAPPAIIERDNVYFFGSRAVAQSTVGLGDMIEGEPPSISKAGIRTLTHIFAFDVFCDNVDRNPRNYLMSNVPSQGSVLAIDFSQAWLNSGSLPTDLLPRNCTTRHLARTYRRLIPEFGNPQDFIEAIDKIDEIPESYIDDILRQQPPGWLQKPTIKTILKWWRDKRPIRTRGLRDGILNDQII